MNTERSPQAQRPGDAAARRDHLVELLGPVVGDAGLDLEDVEVVPAGRRRMVRIVVDGDAGVGLDDIAEVSRTVSAALDSSDAMGTSPYVLEVTSPGVDRPLTEERHWRRAAGRLVTVRLRDGEEVTGRVVAADTTAVVLDVHGAEHRYDYAAVDRGKVQVEFRHDDGDGA